jgi:peptidoglycan/LPS O-acetylase OafA/YrhL
MARVRWRPVLIFTGLLSLIAVGLRYFYELNIPFLGSSFLHFLSQGWLFPVHIFFFSLGIVMGFHLRKFKYWIQRFRYLFVLGLIVFLILGIIEWELLFTASGRKWIAPFPTIIDYLYAASFLMTFLAWDNSRLLQSDTLAYLGSKSYGIYLVHSPALEYTSRLLYHGAPFILAHQLLLQPILWLAGLGIPLLLMSLVNRSPFRRFYSYFFG